MLHCVQWSLIYNSQKLETTRKFLNGRMDTENVIHLHNGILIAIKNDEIMNFVGKWMELENIILSEVTQIQKDMHGMYTLISGF